MPRSTLFEHASEIRLPSETGRAGWQAAIKRAMAELGYKPATVKKATKPRKPRAKYGKTKSECAGLASEACMEPCHWVKASKPHKLRSGAMGVSGAHCSMARVGAKKAKSISQAWEKTFPRAMNQEWL